MALLEVKKLSISFNQIVKGTRQETLNVIDGLDLSIQEGEIVAVVGASGSGKSLLAHAIMGILPDNVLMTGAIYYKDKPLDEASLALYRGNEISLVPQSVSYLNPLMRVGKQLGAHTDDELQRKERRSFLEKLGLKKDVERLFPFQLSGGMARKVLVSTAAISRARLIIADEPTPGMHPGDVTEAVEQFRRLADEGCAVLFITHDIEAALTIADRVAVFNRGAVVETAAASEFCGSGDQLRHPYSKALWL